MHDDPQAALDAAIKARRLDYEARFRHFIFFDRIQSVDESPEVRAKIDIRLEPIIHHRQLYEEVARLEGHDTIPDFHKPPKPLCQMLGNEVGFS